MNKQSIKMAIQKAIDKGKIAQYLRIMSMLHKIDVSIDKDFQREFNAFYKMGQKKPDWYKEYFRFMQESKDGRPEFKSVLMHFQSIFNRHEPSFASKFVATINPKRPVWDQHVFINTKIKRPSYASKNKAQEILAAYDLLQIWYDKFITSKDGVTLLETFRAMVPEHGKISDTKKIDFVLWQTR